MFSSLQAIPGKWWQHMVASIGLFIYLIIVAFYVSEMEPLDVLGRGAGVVDYL